MQGQRLDKEIPHCMVRGRHAASYRTSARTQPALPAEACQPGLRGSRRRTARTQDRRSARCCLSASRKLRSYAGRGAFPTSGSSQLTSPSPGAPGALRRPTPSGRALTEYNGDGSRGLRNIQAGRFARAEFLDFGGLAPRPIGASRRNLASLDQRAQFFGTEILHRLGEQDDVFAEDVQLHGLDDLRPLMECRLERDLLRVCIWKP